MFKIKNTETYNDICIIIKMMNPLMRKKIDSDFIDYLGVATALMNSSPQGN